MEVSQAKTVEPGQPHLPTSEGGGPTSAGNPESEQYDDGRNRFAAERLRVLYYLGLAANLAFILADFILYREHVPALLPYRAVIEIGFLVVLVALFRGVAFRRPALPLIAWILIGNLCIAQMTTMLGGFTSLYFNGLNLVFLAAAVIVPISWPSHLAAQVVTLVYYYGANLMRPMTAPDVNAAIANFFVLVWSCAAYLFAVFLYERVQRREFEAQKAERRARKELEASNEKLRELDRLKTEFFANISHELRTPLTLSLGTYKTLLTVSPSEEVRELIQTGLRNTSRLLFLINELLDLAKFDSGTAGVRKRCIDLAALGRGVAANFESSATRRVHLRGFTEPVPVEADPRQMKKVLYNLLSNAFKFSDPEQGQVWIRLSAKADRIDLEVEDNGIGIPRDQLERIFDRFTQVEGSATRRYEGSGIGLALVKEIVTLHGGRIAIESELGRGSTFTITLPRGDAGPEKIVAMEEDDAFEIPILREERPEPTEPPPVSGSESADLPLVLVADDNPDMRAYLQRVLTRQHRIVLAKDGVEALEHARTLRPDLILTDAMMPRMSGYDLLKAVRGDPSLRSIPVIFLTARAGTDARIESLEAGADDYIAKPFDEHEVVVRVRNLVRARAQEREIARLQHEKLKRFLPTHLADLLLSGRGDEFLKSHRREITVVFIDLRGFTAFAESAAPEDLIAVMREYQVEMGRVIAASQGTLERFSGDALMVFFNDPIPMPNHAEQAVRMAVAMRDRIAELRTRWTQRGFQLGAGIGIATGYATLGVIGFEGRTDYAAIGSVVNLAARLCGEAQHGHILVSGRSFQLIEGLVRTEAVGNLALKGFQGPAAAYNVIGLSA